jgi:diguanylate cyclase (GGDEF)-like protein/PAS domain S-box-containing protein
MTIHHTSSVVLAHPSASERHVTDPIESALLTLLESHPNAFVFAVGGIGSPKAIPLPESVPVQDHEVLDGTRSLLDEVLPADRVVVAKVWGEARAQGAAVAPIRLMSDPTRPRSLYLLDLRGKYHAMIGILTEAMSAPSPSIVEAARVPLLPPRFARATKDASAVFTWVDPVLSQILGWTPEELLSRRAVELVHPDDQELGIASWMEMLSSTDWKRPVRLRHRHRDGSWVWLEVTNQNRLDDPEHGDVLAEMLDISEEMAAIHALQAREQLLGQLTETVPVGLFHVDLDGNLLFANQRFHEITGIASGSTLENQLTRVEAEDRARLDQSVDAAIGGADIDIEIRVVDIDGALTHCTVNIRPLRDESGKVTGLTGCMEDVTATVHTRHELEARAVTDSLTGCLNRTATLTVLQELLDRGSAVDTGPVGTAVIFLDLEKFKAVNDQRGHAVGDQVLLRAAERIRASLRSGDIVGRMGGDEFVVLCAGVSSSDHAVAIARSLTTRTFGCPMDISGTMVEVRASIGVTWTDARGMTAAVLVDQADAAMYRSKRDGRSEPVLFI